MKPSQLLKKGWCQGAYAVDKQGHEVDYRSTNASCYCMMGAVFACAGFISIAHYVDTAKKHINGSEVYVWNDMKGRTKEEVIELCKKVEKELGL